MKTKSFIVMAFILLMVYAAYGQYLSTYTGAELDEVVLKVVSVSNGTGQASKALILDEDLNIANINKLSADTLVVSGVVIIPGTRSGERLVKVDTLGIMTNTDLVDWVVSSSDSMIIVTDDLDGTITLSLPQAIDTLATVEFGGVNVTRSGITTVSIDVSGQLSVIQADNGGASVGSLIEILQQAGETYSGTTAGLTIKNYDEDATVVHGSGENTGLAVFMKQLSASLAGGENSIMSLHSHASALGKLDHGVVVYPDTVGSVFAVRAAVIDYGLDFYDRANVTVNNAEIRGSNGETIDNITNGEWGFGAADLVATGDLEIGSIASDSVVTADYFTVTVDRSTDEYDFYYDLTDRDGGVFPDSGPFKTYIYNTEVDREATEDMTGDSRDVMYKGVYRNYGQNDASSQVQGIGISVRNESGGTMGTIKGAEFAVNTKSGATSTSVTGLEATVEHYSAGATTNLYGAKFDIRNEGAEATNQYGLVITNTDNSTANASDATIYITDTGTNTGWDYGIDMSSATIGISDIICNNGATIYNSTADLLTITEATVDVDGAFTAGSVTSDAGVSGTAITGSLEANFTNNAAAVTFGAVGTDADVLLTFDAVTSQGSITFMEDEDRFDFDNDVDVIRCFTAGSVTSDANIAGLTYGSDSSISDAELLVLDDGALTEIFVGGGAGVTPVWTTATGTGAPVRAGSPSFTTQITTPDISVTDDVLLADGAVVGITGNEVITFLAAGSINFTGATVDVDGAFTASSVVSDGAVGGTDITGSAEANFTNNAAAVTFGAVGTDADVVLAFDAVTAQGSITYMEDEDRFDFDNDVDVIGDFTAATITSDAGVSGTILSNSALQSTTLGSGVTTFALTSNSITLTGDGGANTLGTITGAEIGVYVIEFVDGLITVTDTDAGTADTIDLLGTATNLTSADDTTLMIWYNGTSFLEVSRSVN